MMVQASETLHYLSATTAHASSSDNYDENVPNRADYTSHEAWLRAVLSASLQQSSVTQEFHSPQDDEDDSSSQQQ